jgi:hypothetical protein
LKYHCADEEKVKEYINEAQHMDGYSFWDNFTNKKQLTGDFDLYYKFYESREST